MRSDVLLRKQLTSCRDFKSPRPLYRGTFFQLKKKLLEIGVSLMSSSEAGCVLWETPGSWLGKGWVGADTALLKGAGFFPKGDKARLRVDGHYSSSYELGVGEGSR